MRGQTVPSPTCQPAPAPRAGPEPNGLFTGVRGAGCGTDGSAEAGERKDPPVPGGGDQRPGGDPLDAYRIRGP